MKNKQLGHNVISLYTQRVTKLVVKPKTLFLCFAEDGFPIQYTDNNVKLRMMLPTSFKSPELKIYPNYVKMIPPEFKRNMVLNDHMLKTGKSAALDINYLTYRIHNILYKNNNKIIKKIISYYDNVFNTVLSPDKFRKLNYTNVVFNYILDISNLTEKLAISDMKYNLLGVIGYLIKSKDFSFKQEQIVLTIKNKIGTTNVLIYKEGQQFNINKVIGIINSLIISPEDEVEFEAKLTEIHDKITEKMTKSKIDEALISLAIDSVDKYLYNNIDKINTPISKLIELGVKEELATNKIEEKSTSPIKMLEKLSEIKSTPILVKNSDSEFNNTFNSNKTLGSSLNFRKESMQKHLLSQIKAFDEYFQKMYNIKISKISVNKKKSKSIHYTMYDQLTMDFKDKNGKPLKLKFDLPEGLIEGDSFVKIDGIKRTLIYQLYQDPVMSPVPFTSVIKTNYSAVTITAETKNKNRGIYAYAVGKKVSYLEFIAAASLYDCKSNDKCSKDCFKFVLNNAGVTGYKITAPDKSIDDSISIIVAGVKYYVNTSDSKNSQIFKAFVSELKKNTFDSCDEIVNILENKHGASFVRSAKQLSDNMIDPTVKFVLKSDKKSTNVFSLYQQGVDSAISGTTTSQIDLDNRRLRSSEVLSVAIFKKINPALNQYNISKKEPNINTNAILQELSTGSLQTQFQKVQNQNPLSELAFATRVTYSGLNGIVPENAPLSLRGVDDSFYGLIDPIDTPDSKAVGVTRHLAVDSNTSKISGNFDQNSMDSEINPLSLASNYSPAPGHNDGNRLQFVSSQLRSDLPCVNSELPLLMSSYSNIPVHLASDSFVEKSKINGKVLEVGEDYIIVKRPNKVKPIVISFEKYSNNESNSLITKVPTVKVGDTITENQPIASAKEFFDLNNMKLGVNAYTLLKPHSIANFEDGIIISEAYAKKSASSHGYEIPALLSEDEMVVNILDISNGPITVNKSDIIMSKSSMNSKLEYDENFEHTGILMEANENDDTEEDALGSTFEDNVDDQDDGEIMSEFNSNIYSNVDSELYQIDVFAKDIDTLKKYPELYNIWVNNVKSLESKINAFKSSKVDTDVLDAKLSQTKDIFGKTYKSGPINNILVIFKLKAIKGVKIGDKLHNRHGNKGVVTQILSVDKMPRDLKGKPFEVIINPAGVPSRKNAGQLLEMYTTRIVKHVSAIVSSLIKDQKYHEVISEIITMNELLQPKDQAKIVETKLKKLKGKQLEKFIMEISDKDVPLVVGPLNNISIKRILKAYSHYGVNPKDKIYDPIIGRRTKTAVAYGYIYWGRTEHLSDKGMHGRSIGAVQESTGQAVKGSKNEGGQRLGELDMYGLLGYDLNDYLKEVTTLLSDDAKSKSKAIRSIYQNGSVSLSDLKNSESNATKQLNAYLTCMGVFIE